MLAQTLELTQYQPAHEGAPLPRQAAVLIGLLVLLAFGLEIIWRLAQHLGVIAHEGAHVVAGWGVGRRVQGIKLNGDGTGGTITVGPERGMGRIITSFAGYLGPSIFGLAAAILIAQDQIQVVLWLAVVFLAIMLLLVRNFFGGISVIVNGGLIFLVLRYGDAEVQTIAAYVLSWFMLFSGVRMVLKHNVNAGDADTLRRITRVPRFMWAALWLVITVLALWVGSRILI